MDADGATDSDIWPANPGRPPPVTALPSVHPHGAVHRTELNSFPLDLGIRPVRIPTCSGDTCPRIGPDQVGSWSRKYADRNQRHNF